MYNYLFKNQDKPETFKRQFIKKIVNRYKFNQAIETGTYLGKTALLLSKNVTVVYSIELSPKLCLFLKKKFTNKNIVIIEGDSSKELLKLIPRLNGATLFYLDGHTSGGITAKGEKVTPLSNELSALSNFDDISQSVIIIDDKLSLNGENDYPDLESIVNFAENHKMRFFNPKMNAVVLIGRRVMRISSTNRLRDFRLK